MKASSFLSRFGHNRAATKWIALVFLGSLVASACKKKDEDTYLLGPDQDGDGWPYELDCNDRDDTVFPSADDIPGDGIDQDCSGKDGTEIGFGGAGNGGNLGSGGAVGTGGDSAVTGGQGGMPVTRDGDADGDGFLGYPNGEDCDDDRLSVYPGAPEIPLNGIDENCDGSDLVGGEQLIFPLSDEAEPYEPPDIARGLVGGEEHFLMVWSDSRNAPGQDLYGQLLDEDGNAVGDEIEIETSDADQKTDVRVASKGDGFLITWVTVNGLFVRQLGEDGVPSGIVLGYGPAGSVDPSPAYSAGHWAVTWRTPGGDEAWVRAMTLEGARGDVIELGDGEITSVSVTGRESGFLAVWRGPIDLDTYGIWMHERSLTGYPVGEANDVVSGNYIEPRVAWNGSELLLTMTQASALSYLVGLTFDDDLAPQQATPFRLSSETLYLQGTRTVGSEFGFFSAWDDGRFVTHVPSVQSVYGNRIQDVVDGDPQISWPASRAQVADIDVQLGGVAMGTSTTALSVQFGGVAGLLFLDE